VGGEAGEGEENCPARVGARSGKNVHKLKTFSNVVVLFWRIFFLPGIVSFRRET